MYALQIYMGPDIGHLWLCSDDPQIMETFENIEDARAAAKIWKKSAATIYEWDAEKDQPIKQVK